MPIPDAHKNFAYSTVAVAPSSATAGLTLTVAAGHGARFPAVPFNATVWPIAAIPSPANAEVVRVTARATDVLTIVRAQESSTARAIVVGDQIAATVTAKTLTDVEAGATLLRKFSGSSTAAGATTLDWITIPVGQMTPDSTLRVYVSFSCLTQAVVAPSLYHVEDSLTLGTWFALAAGDEFIGHAILRRSPFATTRTFINMGLGNNVANSVKVTTVTPWLSGWSLGLRHGGITAGGTLNWSWVVYQLQVGP